MSIYIRNIFKIAFAVLLFMGCSESLEPKPATYSKLLTGDNSKSWVLSNLYFVFEDDQFDPVDITDLLLPCEQDDLYTFYREGKVLEITEGGTKCDPDNPDLIARTSWDIVNANASLLFGSNVDYTLFELTSEKLVYGYKDTLTFPVFEDIPVYDEVVGFYEWNYKVDSEN
jgi:hypothetical protein